jgi:hypothetical protein
MQQSYPIIMLEKYNATARPIVVIATKIKCQTINFWDRINFTRCIWNMTIYRFKILIQLADPIAKSTVFQKVLTALPNVNY